MIIDDSTMRRHSHHFMIFTFPLLLSLGMTPRNRFCGTPLNLSRDHFLHLAAPEHWDYHFMFNGQWIYSQRIAITDKIFLHRCPQSKLAWIDSHSLCFWNPFSTPWFLVLVVRIGVLGFGFCPTASDILLCLTYYFRRPTTTMTSVHRLRFER